MKKKKLGQIETDYFLGTEEGDPEELIIKPEEIRKKLMGN